MNVNRTTVMSNFLWRLMERMGAQLVAGIVSVVLARILLPTDYGTVALINVFINILTVFITSGFSAALIQKKDADDLDFSSVFIVQMLICIALYFILFLLSPAIARFYGIPELTSMMRVVGLTLIVAGVKNIQISYVSRHMIFKKFFFATLGGTIGAAVIGIGMALAGMGAWALIGQHMFNNIIDTVILWATVKWRPKKQFSLERVKKLLSYGWKLLASAMIDTIYNNLRSMVIGKVYSSADLAFYDQGRRWPHLVISNINTSIDSVLLPSMSSQQDNTERVKAMTRRAIKTSTYIMAPLLMGFAFCGEPVIRLLLTEKWLPCVPFVRIFCVAYLFYPIHTANLNAIKAMGRSDLYLKLEIMKKIVGTVLMLIAIPISVLAIGYSLLVGSVFSQIINSRPSKKLLNYGYVDQMKDIMPGILLAVFMGFAVYWFKYLPIHSALIVLIQLIVGLGIFIGGSMLFRIDSYAYVKSMMKERLWKKKK